MNTTQLWRRRTLVLVPLIVGSVALGACGTKVMADGPDPAFASSNQVAEQATAAGGGLVANRFKAFQ